MSKLIGMLGLVALTSMSTKAEEWLTPPQQEAKVEEILAREVTHLSPKSLRARILNDPNLVTQVGSEQAADDFFQAYEKKLRPLTDKRFPQAAQVRTPLIESFNLTNDFCRAVFGSGSGFGHRRARIPGYLEWDLYSGYAGRFSEPCETRYTLDDIRGVATTIFRANWERRAMEILDGEAPRNVASGLKEYLPLLEEALSNLAAAEEKLPEGGRCYFRKRLMRELARFL